MNPEDILKENNIILPEAADPVGSYVAAKIIGKLLYISGQISIGSDGKLIKGKLGKDLTVEDGYKAAERCALSIVSQVKKVCDGDLSRIKECVKLVNETKIAKPKTSHVLKLMRFYQLVSEIKNVIKK